MEQMISRELPLKIKEPELPQGEVHQECRKVAESLRDDIITAAVQNIKLLSFLEMAQYLNSGMDMEDIMSKLLVQMKLVTHAQKVYFILKNLDEKYQIYSMGSDYKLRIRNISERRLKAIQKLYPESKGTPIGVSRILNRQAGLNRKRSENNQIPRKTIQKSEKMVLISQIVAHNKPLGFFVASGNQRLSFFESRDRLIIEAFMEQVGMAVLNSHLSSLTYTDSLTGLYVRRYLEDQVKAEIPRFKRTGRTFSLILMDADNFKSVNDSFGHPVGDSVLGTIAKIIRKEIRDMDVPVRMGGEEFAILLPETPLSAAEKVAERIRRSIEKQFSGTPHKTTVSLGVCEYSRGLDFLQLYKNADLALYQAKKAGKNKVIAL